MQKIKKWLSKAIGFKFKSHETYRFTWGEFAPEWGLSLGVGCNGEDSRACLYFCLLWGKFFIKLWEDSAWKHNDVWDSYSISLDLENHMVHLYWGERWSEIIYLPWMWEHVRHEVLTPDGTWKEPTEIYEGEPDNRYYVKYPYTYTLKSGEVQNRIATISAERREWRWYWFRWLPWPRIIKQCIEVEFDDEVGEGAGSWKGGVLGTGHEMKPGETPLQTLRRMETERVFN